MGIFLVSVALVSAYAQTTNDGDFLHSYKVNVNDVVGSWFSTDHVASISKDIDAVETELMRADMLLSARALNADEAARRKADLLERIAGVQEVVVTLQSKTKSSYEMSQLKSELGRLETILEVYDATISSLDTLAELSAEKDRATDGAVVPSGRVRLASALSETVVVLNEEVHEVKEKPKVLTRTNEATLGAYLELDDTDETSDSQ